MIRFQVLCGRSEQIIGDVPILLECLEWVLELDCVGVHVKLEDDPTKGKELGEALEGGIGEVCFPCVVPLGESVCKPLLIHEVELTLREKASDSITILLREQGGISAVVNVDQLSQSSDGLNRGEEVVLGRGLEP